jgi:hypothetical protein
MIMEAFQCIAAVGQPRLFGWHARYRPVTVRPAAAAFTFGAL